MSQSSIVPIKVAGELKEPDYDIFLLTEHRDWAKIVWDGWSSFGHECIFRVNLEEATRFACGLAPSALKYSKNAIVRFYIDDVAVGESAKPGQLIPEIVLPAGSYVFRCVVVSPVRYFNSGGPAPSGNVVWAFTPGELYATRANTLFLGAAAFGSKTTTSVALFSKSAAEQGIPYAFYDYKAEYTTFYEHKIKHFYEQCLEYKKKGIEYLVSIDTRDIIFRQPVDIILGKFNALYDGRILISTDSPGIIHPYFVYDHSRLYYEFQKILGDRCELNTGVIAGHVDDLITVYENIFKLRQQYLDGNLQLPVAKYLIENYVPSQPKFNIENDDQALHFLNALEHPEWYQLDSNRIFSAFILNFPPDSKMHEEPTTNNAICSAPILHASRPASRGHWEMMYEKKWWEEDETKRENIPVEFPALELNICYSCNLKCNYCAHLGQFLKGMITVEEAYEWCNAWKGRLLPHQVRILGGEPTLHPNLAQIVRIVHDTFPSSARVIVTNGLVPMEDKDTLQAIFETNTFIRVSKHFDQEPLNKKIDEQVAFWKANQLLVEVRNYFNSFQKYYEIENQLPVPMFSDCAETSYHECSTQRNCVTLLNGCLYMCPQAALYQHGYLTGQLGELWRAAADYLPLLPSSTRSELVQFLSCTKARAICKLCPAVKQYAPAEQKTPL